MRDDSVANSDAVTKQHQASKFEEAKQGDQQDEQKGRPRVRKL